MDKASDKKIGLLSLIAISVSGIIGSGWLFSAYIGARIAGSGVFLSWGCTLIFFLLMAFVISEIASMFPVRGLVGRMGVISHNKFFGAIFSFAIWLELVGSMPGEAQASVEYLSSLSPGISKALMMDGSLTFIGLLVTLGFLVIYWLINIFGIKFFAKINNSIAVYKLIVPIALAFIIMIYAFNTANFEAYHHEFMPYGFNSIFMAITGAGMIYAFNGFQLGTSFASEVKNPTRNLPLGMILSIIICFIVYMLLQVCFIGALDGAQLEKNGWRALNYDSPFVQLTTLLGLNFMSIILYVDAFISPSGTGITFVGSASRVLCGMAQEKQMPKAFAKVDPKLNFSKTSMGFNFIVALIFLFLFNSWAVLILFITALIVLMYMVVPISLIGMRHAYPDLERKFKLPWARLICNILFILQAWIFVFIGARDMTYLTIAITVFMFIFMVINVPKHGEYKLKDIASVSIPFLIYLWIVTILILIGPAQYGGAAIISVPVLFGLIAIISIYSFWFLTTKKFVTKCQVMRACDEKMDA